LNIYNCTTSGVTLDIQRKLLAINEKFYTFSRLKRPFYWTKNKEKA